jgi:hypothetical protein
MKKYMTRYGIKYLIRLKNEFFMNCIGYWITKNKKGNCIAPANPAPEAF